MRFTITPLGSSGGRSVGQVVGDIVRYLDTPTPPSLTGVGLSGPGQDGPSRYYADGSNEAGRWLGNGAAEMSLSGSVSARDFARVLAGRDPHSGVRLITAQGSAGRTPTLARGTQTRWDSDGEPIYDMGDAATALKLQPAELENLVGVGQAWTAHGVAALLGSDAPVVQAECEGSYVLATTDPDGVRWISEAEIQRVEAARCAGPDPDAIAAAGGSGDLLGLGEASRIAGVSTRYLRSLCGKWERNRDKIEAARAAGQNPRRPFLVAHRGVKGQWLVKRMDLVDYLRHRRPPAVRVGYDLTLTTEKSLGVLALLGDDDTRVAVLDAIQAGNDRGLAHLEYTAAMARAKGEPVSTRGWTVASFRHLTSRALDPFPHHHNVVANTVIDPEETRRALDARWLYRHVGEASALATAEMRYRLTTGLGIRWRRGRKGGWEIDGIPDEVLRAFSRRSGEVDEAVVELEALIGRTATIGELRGLVTKTRPAKRQVDAADLVAEWWDRAEGLGFAPGDLAACVGGTAPVSLVVSDEVIFERLASVDGLCSATSVFTRADVIAAVVDIAITDGDGREQPLVLPADAVQRIADRFLASDYVVELLAEKRRCIAKLEDQPVFTTTAMLTVQARILERFRTGRSVGTAVVSGVALEEAFIGTGHLSDEQRELVRSFCTSGDRIQCGIGRAGTGKTTAMRSAVAAWNAAGYRVLGAAVKGEAARHLGHEAGIKSETLAWHLAHTDPQSGPLDGRTVLIVDEASTVSDRDLDQLFWLCEQTGAALRLIGDPAQHGAVGAGGMFGVLCAEPASSTPELRTSHRVVNEHDRAAADALREGRVADALDQLKVAGHLHVVTDELDLYLDLLERWWQARRDGDEHPMVDRRNRTRWQLNRLAHRLLQVTGDVGSDEIVAARDRRFSVGDRVVARIGDRTLHPAGRPADYVRNGSTGRVVGITKDQSQKRDTIRVAFDRLGEVELPRSFFDEHAGVRGRIQVGLDHAYAVTSYSVQGLTFTESTSRIDENASRSETYVDITRGRSANHLYLTRSIDPLDGERLPKAPPPPIAVTVGTRLAASGPERAAVDIDPGAPAAAATRLGRDLGQLRADLSDNGAGDAIASAEELRARQAARVATSAIDPAVISRLPPRSDVPFLARQWDDTVADLGVFLARWNVAPGGPGRWEWALGPSGGSTEIQAERCQIAERLVDLTVATTAEDFRAAGTDLPPWALTHLAHHVARGRCVQDVDMLIPLYEGIDAYRRRAGVEDRDAPASPEDALFGPSPDDSVLRTMRRALSREAFPQAAARTRSGAGLARR